MVILSVSFIAFNRQDMLVEEFCVTQKETKNNVMRVITQKTGRKSTVLNVSVLDVSILHTLIWRLTPPFFCFATGLWRIFFFFFILYQFASASSLVLSMISEREKGKKKKKKKNKILIKNPKPPCRELTLKITSMH